MYQLLLSYFYKGIIYLIENIQNHKKYIGKTGEENVIKYIDDHFVDALKGYQPKKYFYNAIRKYGKENFKVIILGEIYSDNLEDFNKQLNQAEIECIFHFRTFGADGEHRDNIYGYNCTKGGDGCIGANFQTSRKGKSNIEVYGKEKACQMAKATSIGVSENAKINPNFGMKNKHHTKESIGIIKEKRKLQVCTAETKKKMSDKNTGKNNPMFNKSLYSVWLEKYGIDVANKKYLEWKNSNSLGLEIYSNDIINLYINDKISMDKISKKFNCSYSVIRRILINNNIILRKDLSKYYDKIIDLYQNNKDSLTTIGKKFDCNGSVIRKILLKNNIYIRSNGETLLGKPSNKKGKTYKI